MVVVSRRRKTAELRIEKGRKMQGCALSCVGLSNMKGMCIADFVGWIEKMHMHENKALKKEK